MRFFIPDDPSRIHSVSTSGGGFCLICEFELPQGKKKKKKTQHPSEMHVLRLGKSLQL